MLTFHIGLSNDYFEHSLKVEIFVGCFEALLMSIFETSRVKKYRKVKVGNGKEMAQSERNPQSKNRGGENTKLTIRHL